MTVLSYLQNRASNAVLSSSEKESITTSIATLQTRLNSYFGNNIKNKFQFGSSTRGTILPRSMDSHSDIDYMIVFYNGNYTPQTYLNNLRTFVERHYSTSEIRQSHPTIVLELNHIKFDLVPAIEDSWEKLKIPDKSNNWQYTDPNDFNNNLTIKNTNEKSLIKPTIRLVKYWNVKNDYLYNSFELEKWIIGLNFWNCANQRDYLFAVFDNLNPYNENTQWRKDKITRAKKIIAQVREYENQNMPYSAETEVKNLIPE